MAEHKAQELFDIHCEIRRYMLNSNICSHKILEPSTAFERPTCWSLHVFLRMRRNQYFIMENVFLTLRPYENKVLRQRITGSVAKTIVIYCYFNEINWPNIQCSHCCHLRTPVAKRTSLLQNWRVLDFETAKGKKNDSSY